MKREEENKRTEQQQGIYRGYLLFWGEYQIYLIECGENTDIFTERDEIYLVFTPKKVNFPFIYTQWKIQKAQPNFFPGRFSFDLTFSVCLVTIILDVN